MAFTFLMILLASGVFTQNIFINQVPEYSAMPACAEAPVSAIVRDMDYGCGDGKHTTSYSCFCIDSSSHYDEVISSAVTSACTAIDASSAASEALDVFASYCKLGSGTSGKSLFKRCLSVLEAKRRTKAVLVVSATAVSNSSSPATVSSSSLSSTYAQVRTATGPIPSNTSGASQSVRRTLMFVISTVLSAVVAGLTLL